MTPPPPQLRGLYQGIWGSAWGLAFFIGPAVGGFVYGAYGGPVLWAGTFVIGLVLVAGYLLLSVPAARRMHAEAVETTGETT